MIIDKLENGLRNISREAGAGAGRVGSGVGMGQGGSYPGSGRMLTPPQPTFQPLATTASGDSFTFEIFLVSKLVVVRIRHQEMQMY